MIDSEIKRFIAKEIERQLNVIASGQSGSNTVSTENIESLFPGMPVLENRPIMHPFGLVSRAPNGIISVTARQGNHPGAYLTLGHRDKDRPEVLVGETAVYSVGKYQVTIKNDKLLIGKNGDFEEIPMGETLRQFLITFIDLVIQHQHIGNLGYQTSTPINAGDMTAAKAEFLDNSKILAKDGGRF